jgi:hypothetical protein
MQNRVTTTQATSTRRETYTIEVTIRPDGQIESEVKGVCGPECEGLTEWMEDIGTVTEHRSTPDASRRPEQVRTSGVRVGGDKPAS